MTKLNETQIAWLAANGWERSAGLKNVSVFQKWFGTPYTVGSRCYKISKSYKGWFCNFATYGEGEWTNGGMPTVLIHDGDLKDCFAAAEKHAK